MKPISSLLAWLCLLSEEFFVTMSLASTSASEGFVFLPTAKNSIGSLPQKSAGTTQALGNKSSCCLLTPIALLTAGALVGHKFGKKQAKVPRSVQDVVGRADLLRASWWKLPLPFQGKRTEKGIATLEKVQEEDGSSPEEELRLLRATGPMKVAMLGTRECPFQHQQEIELLSEARVCRGDHIYTSGSSGTNASVIRGALRAGVPKLLTIVLPQSYSKQSKDSQALLRKCVDSGVEVLPMPKNDNLPLAEAARICNSSVLEKVDRLVAFASHESTVYVSLIEEAKKNGVLATAFFLD